MDRRTASKISNEAASFYDIHDDVARGQHNRINTGLFLQLQDFIPDDATTAVIEHENGLPLILALDGDRLFSMDVPEEFFAEGPISQTRCRMIVLLPARCSVEAQTSYHESFGEQWRVTTWHFKVGDLEFEVETRAGDDTEPDRREVFAQSLARALGWNFNLRETAQEPVLSVRAA